MAEFKLGRIRFVWKNNWSTSTIYYKDDVIAYGGKMYICVIGHTSAPDFFTDLDIVPSKWNLVSDGQTYKDDWTTNTFYVYDDIVKYGARLYICNTIHTSAATVGDGLEADLSKWDVYAEGLDFKGDWTISTRYRVNDTVKYGATTYRCNTLHTSASNITDGLELDLSKWDIINQGIDYKSTWQSSVRYKKNDVVSYGAGLWIATAPHTSTNSFSADSANWGQFVQGFQFEDEWSPTALYQVGDVVKSGGNQYISETNHVGIDPQTDNGTNWTLFLQGLKYVGEYNEDSSAVEYNAGELVSRGGYLYVAKQKHSSESVTNTTYWTQISTGLRWTGVWVDDREYVLGDVVRFGQNSYVCILGHISEGDDFSTVTLTDPGGGNENSRPDLDITGTYWNVLVIGTETGVLTTDGDLVYYSSGGPTRLPIGKEGQLLRVSNTSIPEWVYYGVTEDVYYVAEHGFDGPAPLHGRTIDKPWRSIRYATEQIEKGTKNPNARRLLELNKFFIQRETVEWVDYQIANAGVGDLFDGFTYAESKCERDMGYIVDALIWDITHGGNVESRKVALEYVNNAPIFYTFGQEAETVAAINYALTLMEKILDNEAPLVNYQTTNGDNSTAVVDQFFDTSLEVEDVLPTITSLITIITDAITAGTDTNIPDRIVRNTLVKVSTGRYYEMLPIIVPAECCIMGDELRSTNVQPRKASNTSLVSIFDSQFSYRAVVRMEEIVGNIVQGITVTPTSGNTETQSQLFPFGDVIEGIAASQAMRTIRKEIDFGLGQKLDAFPLPNPPSFDNDRGYARDLIRINKDFIQAEVIAYITNEYPSLKYSKTKCKQDIGYILDALSYDLTYGGNWQSVNAGAAYYAGTGGAFQIDSEEKTATLAAYTYLRDILAPISRSIAVSPLEQTVVTQITGQAGSVSAASAITTNLNTIISIINTGTSPTITYPVISGVSGALQSDHAALINGTNLTTVKNSVISFITTNFPNLTYDTNKCRRDIELIAYAAAYDGVFGSKLASMVAAFAYRRSSSNKVYGEQSEATIAANLYAASLLKAYTAQSQMDNAIDAAFGYANDMIFAATKDEGSNKAIERPNNHHAVRQLELNKDFIKAEIHAYIDDYFSDTVTSTNNSNNRLTIADTSWMSKNMPIQFFNPEDSTQAVSNAGLVAFQTYYVRNIISSTQFTISSTSNGSIQTLVATEGDFIIKAFYDYNENICNRDVDAYIDAVKWDLVHPRDYERNYTNSINVYLPSNYKSNLAARYYINSVLGCQEEDFFYLRNGTGLRLMTLDGLQGDLTPTNDLGTRRVTAGAYASLDPGWGPSDQAVWINSRSPYVQNVTTFGYAATGQRIDGSLHDGGNDSIVSNDFTQVISDGIGAHILNNGRAELVSVFTYYAHIGYLAESGGRIRATNGNNSYGTFGSVAEGVDSTETPSTGIVDNKFQYVATVGDVFCDGDQIIALEYSHAGNDYTEATMNIFGAGSGEELDYTDKDTRDDGVFQVRITELNDSSGLAGGSEYNIVQNTAQTGSSSSLTLAATDGALSTDYVGMKLIITGGAGVGNYGIIATYNAGSKVATVNRESDGLAGWDNLLEGKSITTPNASSTYIIEPNVTFSAPPRSATQHSVSSGTWGEMVYHSRTAQYTNVSATSGSGSGATFDVDKVGSKYYITVNNAGSGYERLDTLTIGGASVGGQATTNDITITLTTVSTNGAVVEYDYEGLAQKGIFLAFQTASTSYRLSIDGSTWTSGTLPAAIVGVDYNGVASGSIDDGSTLFEPSYVLVTEPVGNNYAYSEDGVTWTSGTYATGITDSKVAYGKNLFMRISSDVTDVYVTADGGANWSNAGSLPAISSDALAYGQGKWWVVYSGTTNAYYSDDDGATWTLSTLPGTGSWTYIVYGDNKVIISSTTAYYMTVDGGSTWTSHSYPAQIDSITYGNGVFVATSAATNNRVYHSEDGIYWETYTPTFGSATQLGSITFGNPNQTGVFLAAGDGTSTLMHKFSIGAKARGRVGVANGRIFEIRLWEPGSGYTTPPTITITDPTNINEATFDVRIGKGQLAQPSFINRGSGFEAANAELNRDLSNGYADFFQSGDFVAIRQVTFRPISGSNVEFDSLPGQIFKLVNTVSFLGTNDGSYTTFLQLSPEMPIADAPAHGDPVTMRIRFSQVRLTGHDFLDIGTGNFADTNYPGTPVNLPNQANETVESDGGRVFFTATDQDGNFRVGELFSVEQSTGIATLNAEAFNIAGLQELTLGEVTLGGNSASINEFSTDPFFTANSDNVVPTQRAIKAYIEAQIGGGGASLNVNSVTAGDIFIATNTITTVAGEVINIKARVNFQGGILGLPLAYNYMLR